MAHLSVLVAEFGEDIPYAGGLAHGFPFRGRRVPFLNYQKGIYRAAVQSGPAALSIQTSAKSPYDDEVIEDGFLYAYRAGDVDQPDNRALRAAHELQVPLVYFIGTRPGWYKPVFPCFVREDDPVARMVLVTPGALRGLSTSRRRCASRIRSSDGTPSARRGCASTRRGSAAGSCRRTAASARSAG